MAKYGSSSLKIEVDNSGGTPVDMSNYITDINGVSVEALLEEGTAFGDAWVEQLYTGIRQMAAVTLGGFYDDTASTGPNVIFNSLGDTRTLTVTWGSTKTTSVEAIITKYDRNATRKALTKFQVTLTPTGAVVEA